VQKLFDLLRGREWDSGREGRLHRPQSTPSERRRAAGRGRRRPPPPPARQTEATPFADGTIFLPDRSPKASPSRQASQTRGVPQRAAAFLEVNTTSSTWDAAVTTTRSKIRRDGSRPMSTTPRTGSTPTTGATAIITTTMLEEEEEVTTVDLAASATTTTMATTSREENISFEAAHRHSNRNSSTSNNSNSRYSSSSKFRISRRQPSTIRSFVGSAGSSTRSPRRSSRN